MELKPLNLIAPKIQASEIFGRAAKKSGLDRILLSNRGVNGWNVPFVSIPKRTNYSKTSKGNQRYCCPSCHQTFTDSIDTLYYSRQLTPAEIERILQSSTEGVSLRGIARISKRSYNTVVDVVRASSQKAQLVHNEEVEDVQTEQVIADEMWSFVKKSKKTVSLEN